MFYDTNDITAYDYYDNNYRITNTEIKQFITPLASVKTNLVSKRIINHYFCFIYYTQIYEVVAAS